MVVVDGAVAVVVACHTVVSQNHRANMRSVMTLCRLEILKGYVGTSEDPDKMQHKAAFHQGLHCL